MATSWPTQVRSDYDGGGSGAKAVKTERVAALVARDETLLECPFQYEFADCTTISSNLVTVYTFHIYNRSSVTGKYLCFRPLCYVASASTGSVALQCGTGSSGTPVTFSNTSPAARIATAAKAVMPLLSVGLEFELIHIYVLLKNANEVTSHVSMDKALMWWFETV